MLLTIYNLPCNTHYAEIKMMIKSKCGLTDIILDNLVRVGDTMKVTVGMAEEADAAILVRKFNGLYVNGQQLYVEDMRQKKPKQQQFLSVKDLIEESQSQRDMYKNVSFQKDDEPQDQYHNQQNQHMVQGFQNQMMVQPNQMMMMPMDYMPAVPALPALPMPYNYYGGMPQVQTPFQGYGNQPQFPENQIQEKAFGFGNAEPNAPEDRWGPNKSYERRNSPSRNFLGNNQRMSRWSEPNQEERVVKRRSRSPRHWDERNSFKNNESTPFDKQYPNEKSRNNYDQNRSVVYTKTFTSSTFRGDSGSGAFSETSNVFAKNIEPPYEPASWDEPPRELNQRSERNSRNTDQNSRNIDRNSRNIDRKQRTWDQDFPRDDHRNDDRNSFRTRVPSAQRPSRPESRRDFQNPPPKRHRERDFERQPEPKRFAADQFQREDRRGPNSKGPQTFQKTRFNEPTFDPNSKGPQTFQKTRFSEPTFDKPRFPKPSSSQYNPVRQEYPKKPAPKFQPPENPTRPQGLTPKDITWRFQTASDIAKEMLRDLEVGIEEKHDILARLKLEIRTRLEDMIGNNSLNIIEMTKAYRQKFPKKHDQKFLLSVLDKVVKENSDAASPVKKQSETKPGNVPVKKEKVEPVAKPKKIQNAAPVSGQNAPTVGAMSKKIQNAAPVSGQNAPAVAAQPKKIQTTTTASFQNSSSAVGNPKKTTASFLFPKAPPVSYQSSVPGRLPKYPNADKSAYNQQKQVQKLEVQIKDMYELPEHLKRHVDEETDKLCDIFMAECENPPEGDEAEKKICELLMDHVSDEFRKVFRLNLTKRILNVKTGLLVRIFFMGKAPKRDKLDKFLKLYGVTSVKKSDKRKMFVGNVDTYKNYDGLLSIGTTVIDNTPVTIKPMHVTGPPKGISKVQIVANRRRFIERQIDRSGENLLQPKNERKEEFANNETCTEAKIDDGNFNKGGEDQHDNNGVANDENIQENFDNVEDQHGDDVHNDNIQENFDNVEDHHGDDVHNDNIRENLENVEGVNEEDWEDY